MIVRPTPLLLQILQLKHEGKVVTQRKSCILLPKEIAMGLHASQTQNVYKREKQMKEMPPVVDGSSVVCLCRQFLFPLSLQR